jgi:ABC-type sugar transport system ATPase subunit
MSDHPNENPAIAVNIARVGKRFAAVQALDDVSFSVRKGELHAVMGENGAGKSTLMKILSGVITEYDGALEVDGQSVQFRGTRDAEDAGIGIIHQELNLVEELSVSANIFLGREKKVALGLLDQRAMDQEAEKLLRQLDSPIRPSERVGSLRVGDQQLVEIAKSLSLQTSILIMDEPTSALTESEVERLYRVIDSLREQGVTILYISHKMDEVFRLSDRITVLRDGKFVRTIDTADTSPKEVAHLMVGREISEPAERAEKLSNQVVLKVESLSLPWPGHSKQWRLQDVSFDLHAGEILGVAGLMGAGRTELLECLYGASDVRAQGRIEVAGEAVSFSHPSEAVAAGVAMVTEDRKRLGLFPHLTVRGNITICSLKELAAGGVVSAAAERDAAQQQAEKLRVKSDGIEASINSLSGGNQQKCIIGRCMMTEPKILLLDDPTRGVDVGAKAELYDLMEQLAADGMAIIVTSSELPELLTVSDRILVLCEGVLTGEYSRKDATEQKIMEAATMQSSTVASV